MARLVLSDHEYKFLITKPNDKFAFFHYLVNMLVPHVISVSPGKDVVVHLLGIDCIKYNLCGLGIFSCEQTFDSI